MRKLPEFLTDQELQSLQKQMPTNMMKDALFIMYVYALRISELCSLVAADVNFEKNLIRIQGKGKLRYLPLKHYTLDVLRQAVKRPGHLFNVSVRSFRNYVYQAADKAQLGHVNPHMIRHSRATHLMNNGNELADIKAWMRHEMAASTLIYTHVALERLSAVIP
jgi:integrase/recombinase XerC